MVREKSKSSKNSAAPFLILLLILFGLISLFVKNKYSKVQPIKEAPMASATTRAQETTWKTYENKHIYFRHPESKTFQGAPGGPVEESRSFEFYGKTGRITMEISIFSTPEEINQVLGGELSTKALAEKAERIKLIQTVRVEFQT